MNYAMIFYLLGRVLSVQAGLMILPSIVAIVYHENTLPDFLLVMVLSIIIGVLLARKRPKNDVIYAREGFVAVSLIWVALSVVGCLPFIVSGEIPSFVDALFETVSGFTTTGSSIVTNVEVLSRSILFWRSFTHWIGGMGVLVFLIALLPLAGGGHNVHLLRAESPGPSVSKLVPKLRTTALILYLIYTGMTLLQILLLVLSGLPLFESMLTAFGTAGTGGLGFLNDSFASMNPAVQTITGIFMMLFGVNFTVYYLILSRRPGQAMRSEELRGYLAIILAVTLFIIVDTRSMFSSFGETLRHAFFQVSSIITTTGYTTSDFNLWPSLSKTLLVLLMFIGAMAGSTGGGLKVSRVIIWFKMMFRELFHLVHPRSVKKVGLEGHALTDESTRSIGVYFFAYFAIFAASIVVISFDNFDMTTNFTAVAATFNNIGPGLEVVGPMGNFSEFSILSKCVLIFDMLAGRLELFPILILFAPATWRK